MSEKAVSVVGNNVVKTSNDLYNADISRILRVFL